MSIQNLRMYQFSVYFILRFVGGGKKTKVMILKKLGLLTSHQQKRKPKKVHNCTTHALFTSMFIAPTISHNVFFCNSAMGQEYYQGSSQMFSLIS